MTATQKIVSRASYVLASTSTLRTIICEKFPRDGHRCTNSWGKCGAKAPPIISAISAFGTGGGLHSLGMKSVRPIQIQCARKASAPIKEGMPLRNGKDESHKSIGTCLVYIKIDQHTHSPRGMIGGLMASERSPFFPSLSSFPLTLIFDHPE